MEGHEKCYYREKKSVGEGTNIYQTKIKTKSHIVSELKHAHLTIFKLAIERRRQELRDLS